MKKAILGVGALLAASVLPVANVFATDPLDYAKSIGSIEGADTINWVVEATSDGGYVVGGQTIGCYRYAGGGVALAAAATVDYAPELVDIQECIDYYTSFDDDDSSEYKFSIFDICESGGGGVRSDKGLSSKGDDDEEIDYYYEVGCVDYIAKFTKDGTKQWLTTIMDEDRPVAVGQTDTDYRLLTDDGMLYVFSNSGEEGISTRLEGHPYVPYAKINGDGSVTANFDGTLCYYKNARLVRCLENSQNEYYQPGGVSGIVRHDDGVLGFHTTYDENGDPVVEIVQISEDLTEIDTVMDVELTDGSYIPIVIISGNKDSDFMVIECEMDNTTEADSFGEAVSGKGVNYNDCQLASYDKNGDKIAEKPLDDFDFDGIDNIFYKDFVMIDSNTGTIARYDRNLNKVFDYTLDSTEIIFDVAPLNDGSIVGVGVSTGTTDNYEVDTAANGVYLRLDANNEEEPKGSNDDNIKNPGTLDMIQVIAGMGGAILLFGAIAGRKLIVRR